MNSAFKLPRIASLFKSNRNQAVRIPKDMEFPEGVKKLIVRRVGDALIFTPPENLWDSFFDRPPNPDFADRDQPPVQERDFNF
jgi:antitoxin VapB